MKQTFSWMAAAAVLALSSCTSSATTNDATAATEATRTTSKAPALMPSVVCMNLQKAQDLIQQTGVFYSTSFDATGAGRDQIVDSNWIVVSQTPAIGEVITEGSADLGAVKLSEPNDCSTTPPASTVATVTPISAEPPVTTVEAPVTTAEAPDTTVEAPDTTAEPPVTAARPRATTTPKTTAAPASVRYANCAEARAAGAAPIYQGEPGYRSGLDADHDGIACDK